MIKNGAKATGDAFLIVVLAVLLIGAVGLKESSDPGKPLWLRLAIVAAILALIAAAVGGVYWW